MPVRLIALVIGLFVLLTTAAQAITGGRPDGNAHPYVAYIDNGSTFCSGTLLSPTVLVTAAHCFSGGASVFGSNTVTGAPLVLTSFDPNLINTPRSQRAWSIGSYYFDPLYRAVPGGGLPHFDAHDVALVVFTAVGCVVPTSPPNSTCGPIPPGVTGSQYGVLPSPGLVDTLPMNTSVDIVGFGAQSFTNGGGPCGGPCTPSPNYPLTRFTATTSRIADKDAISGEYIKLHANKGGVCFGDSGGPDLLGGTNILLAENSFVNGLCSGVTYHERLDIPQSLSWIAATVATQGASLQH